MRIGIISDIHGNDSALMAILNVFYQKKVDNIVCLGDMVGYFHQSLEVLDRIKALKIPVIRGNHEAYLLGERSYSPDRETIYNLGYVRDAISSQVLSWMSALPETLDMTIEGRKISLFHGSPWDPLSGYIYPDYAAFGEFLNVGSDYFFLGHTHYPLDKRVGAKEIINPGSVGLPRNGDCRAQSAIFDTYGGVEFIKENYDIDSFLDSARRNGVHHATIQRLNMK